MAHEDSIIYWPKIAWANDIDDYTCRCHCQERPDGSFLVTVVENGVDLEQLEYSAAEVAETLAFTRALKLRPKYNARYQAEIAKRQPGR